MRRRIAAMCVFALAASTTTAIAADPPAITAPKVGTFRSVLAQGEGQQLNSFEFGAYEASGKPPATYTNHPPLYVDIMPRATSLTAPGVDVLCVAADFGSMPGGVGPTKTPRPGVQICRVKRRSMSHIYG